MITNYLKNHLMRFQFLRDTSSYTPPVKVYLGLSTTPINADGTGMTELESVTGYTRVEITQNNSNWSGPSNGLITNTNSVEFRCV